METQPDNQPAVDPDRIGSRMSRLNPDIFSSQSSTIPDDETDGTCEVEENVFSDEAIDEDGNPTDGSDYTNNDHHQDDNYALGGHVTRTSGE